MRNKQLSIVPPMLLFTSSCCSVSPVGMVFPVLGAVGRARAGGTVLITSGRTSGRCTTSGTEGGTGNFTFYTIIMNNTRYTVRVVH